MKKFLQDSDVLRRRALLGGTVSLGAQANNEAVAD